MATISQKIKIAQFAILVLSLINGQVDPNEAAITNIFTNLPSFFLMKSTDKEGNPLPKPSSLVLKLMKVPTPRYSLNNGMISTLIALDGLDNIYSSKTKTKDDLSKYRSGFVVMVNFMFRDFDTCWFDETNRVDRFTTAMRKLDKMKAVGEYKPLTNPPHEILLESYLKLRKIVTPEITPDELSAGVEPVRTSQIHFMKEEQANQIVDLGKQITEEFSQLHPLNNDHITALHYSLGLCLSILSEYENASRSGVYLELLRVLETNFLKTK